MRVCRVVDGPARQISFPADRGRSFGHRRPDGGARSAASSAWRACLQEKPGVSPLAVSEHLGWINTRRTPLGQPVGERSNSSQNPSGAHKRDRIARLETVEQRRDEFRRPPAHTGTDDHAEPDQHRDSREHKPYEPAGSAPNADGDLRPSGERRRTSSRRISRSLRAARVLSKIPAARRSAGLARGRRSSAQRGHGRRG